MTEKDHRLEEEPSSYERENLPTHVEKCYLRYTMLYKSIEDLRREIGTDLGSVRRVLWVIGLILLSSAVATNLALWLGKTP